jgi:ethanolamine utilization protein EutQ (cupin superfamily)
MVHHIKNPTRIQSAGNKVKLIDEFIGLVNSNDSKVSIARMKSPAGWIEPPQIPEFDEYTFVLKGSVHVKTDEGTFIVNADEIFVAAKNTQVQYSTPGEQGAEYIAICVPAFSPEKVHRGDSIKWNADDTNDADFRRK